MKKKKNIGALIWKNCKAWLFTSLSVLLVFIVATIVATQNVFLSGTISTVLGGDRRVLKAGDPSKYQYYSSDNSDFLQFDPEEEVTYAMSGRDKKNTALKMALQLNEEIAEEGFVLLKNEDETLPILTPETENSAYTTPSSNPKISVFGKNSVDLVYGGSGSGGGDEANNVNLYQALEDAGYEVNPQLKKFYESSKSGKGRGSNPQMGARVYGHATGETPISSYSGLEASYAEYSEAALVVISRIGGEGFDLPRSMVNKYGGSLVSGAEEGAHYLELDKNEKDLINMVCEEFEKVIIVVNCATSMELGFIEENDKIDAAVWVGFSGGNGINALGSLLNGNVNPSGRLVDTYAADFTANPVYANFGDNMQVNGNRYTLSGNTDYYYVDYEESIYVGYRYYETMAFEEAEFGNDMWYEENVVYPFGHGKSYTSFEWTIEETTSNVVALEKDGTIEIKVKVKNIGNVAGKDVVQLYYSAPYEYGKIEKSHVNLGAYEKTGLIQPDETETVTLTLDVEDMASYDWNDANGNGFKGYELDGGKYTIFIGTNSHQAWQEWNELFVDYNVPKDGYTYAEYDGAAVENRFDDVSEHFVDESGNKTLFTREDFRSTFPKAPTAEERETSVDFINSLKFVYNDEEEPYYEEIAPNYGESSDDYIQLYELLQQDENGNWYVSYNDERWETILDYITIDEMAELIGTGNFKTMQIDRINKPRTIDPDGPAGFTNFMGDPSVHGTCYYASECVIGATWNKDLAHDMGVMVGIESLVGYTNGDGRTYSGWYAPAINIHRSPFSGRNWEYYSEDPFLSGMMGANVVLGAQSKGVYTYVKHFALNDQETDRDSNGLITWADEQTMREIYLKPFELVVKVGGTKAMMSSFNRIGTVWAGGSYALLTEVLRDEWGFQGMVISDYNVSNAYMPPDQMIRAGGDLNLTQGYLPSTSGSNYNATHIHAMRKATKNILYVVANSNAMNGLGEGVVYEYAAPLWQVLLVAFDGVLAVGFAVWGFFAIRKAIKKENKKN